jgi:succinoglycan biosynthesis protein ExoV
VDRVLVEIQQTEILLAEAMHGAIVADALRVPWIPVRMYSQFMEFKWRDWTQSIQVPFKLTNVAPIFTRELTLQRALVHAWKKGWAKTGLGKDKWHRLPLRTSSDREISNSLRSLERLARDSNSCLSADKTIYEVETKLSARLSDLREAWQRRQFTPFASPNG